MPNMSSVRKTTCGHTIRRTCPFYHRAWFPLEDLPRLLFAADVHSVTLSRPFVGYVLPSKFHACIASGKRVRFVGSERSDIHLWPGVRYHLANIIGSMSAT